MKHEWNRCWGRLQTVGCEFGWYIAKECGDGFFLWFCGRILHLWGDKFSFSEAWEQRCGWMWSFPKDSHESQIWKSERQCFDWGCQNKKFLICFCIYELHDCCILNDVIVRLEELFLVTALGHSQKSHSVVWTWDYCSFEPLQLSPVLIAFGDDLLLGFSRWLPPNSVEDTLPSRIREHRSWRVGWMTSQPCSAGDNWLVEILSKKM